MKNFFKKFYKFLKILFLVVIIALIIKAFAIDAFQIPSTSMENTLQPGDFIFANKFAYEIATPREIPIANLHIPQYKLFEVGKPQINDIVIFEFPLGFENDPVRGGSKYVKRLIAGPHDTLKITNGKIFVNGAAIKLPSTYKIPNYEKEKDWTQDEVIYPPGATWNRDSYGPIIIPAKGDTIMIAPENFERWQSVIVMDHGERSLLSEGTLVTLDGKAIFEYVLKQDHYFVIGDNFEESMDSRNFGFITDNMIVGKAMFIYWSYDPQKVAPGPLGFLSAIRADRIFKGFN
ncbi:MAG: signal peptidase I [Ignavibacteriaceae bacterium]|jgi:signal peptidase I|nr:signal peptidase I [Ignavibacteriaceae bacterium]MCU0364938.1 signal peptidase I [Ignavibacteriaceae bacterium]MCU0405613.1 signal peptidase I [Ignavibacteriaceae bacterium]MCU0413341.1 signal peptidase I [Ignavibacteriaceae bacterium]